MTSVSARLRTAAGRLLFRRATVTAVSTLTPTFLKLRLDAPGAAAEVGDKVQVLVPEVGMRTYTPFDVDGARGAFSVLAYLHDDGPTARWLKATTEGAEVLFFGPRPSLELSTVTTPLLVVGDETSFALVASLQRLRRVVRAVVEVTSTGESTLALEAIGATAALVERRVADAHFSTLGEAVRDALTANTTLVFTGRARTIQTLRARLRQTRAPHGRQLVKAYWADGKRGID